MLEVAHMYQLAGLVDTCREAALQQITVDNSLHTLATLHKFTLGDGEDGQKEAAVRFVQRNLARVRGTRDWETFASSLPDLVEEVERVERVERVKGSKRKVDGNVKMVNGVKRKVEGKVGRRMKKRGEGKA